MKDDDDTKSVRSLGSRKSGKSAKSAKSSAKSARGRGGGASSTSKLHEAELRAKLSMQIKKQAELSKQIDTTQKNLARIDQDYKISQQDYDVQQRNLRKDLHLLDDELTRDKQIVAETVTDLRDCVAKIRDLRQQYILCCTMVATYFVPPETSGIDIAEIRTRRRRINSLCPSHGGTLPFNVVNLKRYVQQLHREIQIMESGGTVPERGIELPTFFETDFEACLGPEWLTCEEEVQRSPNDSPVPTVTPVLQEEMSEKRKGSDVESVDTARSGGATQSLNQESDETASEVSSERSRTSHASSLGTASQGSKASRLSEAEPSKRPGLRKSRSYKKNIEKSGPKRPQGGRDMGRAPGRLSSRK